MNNERFTFLKGARAMALTLFALCAMGLGQANASCVCSAESTITITKDDTGACLKEIFPIDLAVNTCDDGAWITAELITASEHWKGATSASLAGASIEVAIPGRYRYSVLDAEDGSVLCWNYFNAEDKSGPVCANADGMGDVEDNDLNIKTQIVSCSVEDAYAKFDVLEEDDFMDCTGIKAGSVTSSNAKKSGCALDFATEIALLIPDAAIAAEIEDPTAAIAALPEPAVDMDGMPAGSWEICDIIVKSWSAVDWAGNVSEASAACTQVVVVVRPTELTFAMVDTLVCDGTDIATRGASPLSYLDLRSTADGAGDADGALDICGQPEAATDDELELAVGADDAHACKWSVFADDAQAQYSCTDHDDACNDNKTTGKIVQSVTWVDWCTGEKETMTALTVVLDTVGPTVVVTGTVTQWDNPYDCNVELSLPAITATDDCSNGATVDYVLEVEGAASHSGGSFDRYTKADIDAGATVSAADGSSYSIYIRAWDCCGNETLDTLDGTIVVADERAPTCIANDELNVSLIKTDPHGSTNDHRLGARVHAEDLDDTSHDNCSAVTLDVRDPNAAAGTDNALWGAYVEYDWATSDFETLSNGTCTAKVWLELRVTDAAGNSSICNTEITFSDENAPSLDGCDDTARGKISSVTSVSCTAKTPSFGTTDVWGACITSTTTEGTESFHCPTTVTICDVDYDNVIEVLSRTTTVTKTGEHGTYSDSSTEIILITEEYTEKFTFPYDHKVECDAAGGLNIPAASSLSDILDATGCSEWVMHVSEKTFGGSDGDCYQIIRNYEFINSCRWDVTNINDNSQINRTCADLDNDGKLLRDHNDAQVMVEYSSSFDAGSLDADDDACTIANYARLQAGYFNYTQVIKVFDNVNPTATIATASGCNVATAGCDQGTASFTVTAADACSSASIGDWYINTVDNQAGFTQAGNVFSGSGLASGSYELHVQVSDDCGNFIWATETVTVDQSDCKKPTVIGLANFTALMENCTVDIWLSDVLTSSSDNCTDESKWTYGLELANDGTVSATMPTAQSLTITEAGTNQVALWMNDGNGNTQYTFVPVVAQDNAGDCTDAGNGGGAGAAAAVAGNITNEGDEMVDDVIIDASGSGFTPFAQLINGIFNLEIPMHADVTLTPSKDQNHINGVSGRDLVMLQRHVLGIQELSSAYKLIAADVNADEKVNTRDMADISKLILGIYDEFPNVSSWRFIDKSHTFANPTSPWGFPESIDYANLEADAQADFIGVKMGDISGNAKATQLLGDDNSVVGAMTIAIDNAAIAAGATHDIEFTAKDFNDFAGYQFSIELASGVQFENVELGTLPNHSDANFGFARLSEGVITTNWTNASGIDLEDGAVLFTISVSAANNMDVSEAISINSAVTAAEAYNSDLDRFEVGAQFNRTNANFALFQNTPNPFSAETTIGFELPTSGAISLKVMDVSGRVLKQVGGTYAAGVHQITLNKSDLGATGVLYYQLDTDAHSATKKMVIVE